MNKKVLPSQLVPWLEATTSITDKAKQLVNEVKMELLFYDWIDANPRYLERRIVMRCDGSPWWYAITKIPEKTYLRRKNAFETLGKTPLGDILYSDSGIKRIALEKAYLTAEHKLFSEVKSFLHASSTGIWSRLSTYDVDGEPLYLREFFLPAMLKAL